MFPGGTLVSSPVRCVALPALTTGWTPFMAELSLSCTWPLYRLGKSAPLPFDLPYTYRPNLLVGQRDECAPKMRT